MFQLFILLFVFFTGLGIRNYLVFRYRNEFVIKIAMKSREDAENNLSWRWRFDEYDKISYQEMLFKFWRRIDSFYEKKILK